MVAEAELCFYMGGRVRFWTREHKSCRRLAALTTDEAHTGAYGEHHGGDDEPVLGAQDAQDQAARVEAHADGDGGQRRHDDPEGDDGGLLAGRVQHCAGVGHGRVGGGRVHGEDSAAARLLR